MNATVTAFLICLVLGIPLGFMLHQIWLRSKASRACVVSIKESCKMLLTLSEANLELIAMLDNKDPDESHRLIRKELGRTIDALTKQNRLALQTIRNQARVIADPTLPMDGAVLIVGEYSAMQKRGHYWHDGAENMGELARAAMVFADCAHSQQLGYDKSVCAGSYMQPSHALEWPWDEDSLDLSDDPICNLKKAGALCAAEIDRLLLERSNPTQNLNGEDDDE